MQGYELLRQMEPYINQVYYLYFSLYYVKCQY